MADRTTRLFGDCEACGQYVFDSEPHVVDGFGAWHKACHPTMGQAAQSIVGRTHAEAVAEALDQEPSAAVEVAEAIALDTESDIARAGSPEGADAPEGAQDAEGDVGDPVPSAVPGESDAVEAPLAGGRNGTPPEMALEGIEACEAPKGTNAPRPMSPGGQKVAIPVNPEGEPGGELPEVAPGALWGFKTVLGWELLHRQRVEPLVQAALRVEADADPGFEALFRAGFVGSTEHRLMSAAVFLQGQLHAEAQKTRELTELMQHVLVYVSNVHQQLKETREMHDGLAAVVSSLRQSRAQRRVQNAIVRQTSRQERRKAARKAKKRKEKTA